MLKYKQIWHGIKPIRWLIKFNLTGVVSIYAFLRHSGKVPDFHGEHPATCHFTFAAEITHHFALGDTDYDNHIGRGKQVYIYIYIHTSCTMLAHKVGK